MKLDIIYLLHNILLLQENYFTFRSLDHIENAFTIIAKNTWQHCLGATEHLSIREQSSQSHSGLLESPLLGEY